MENQQETARKIVKSTAEILKEVKPEDKIIFLGRDALPHYVTARKLAESMNIDRSQVKLVQSGKFMLQAANHNPAEKSSQNRKNLEKYLKKLELQKTMEKEGKVLIVDTGIGGTQVKALEKIIHQMHKGVKTQKKLIISSNPYIQGVEKTVPLHLKDEKIKKIFEKRKRKQLRKGKEIEDSKKLFEELKDRQEEFYEKAVTDVLRLENLPKLTVPISGYDKKGKPIYKGKIEPGDPPPNFQEYKEFNQKLSDEITKYIGKIKRLKKA